MNGEPSLQAQEKWFAAANAHYKGTYRVPLKALCRHPAQRDLEKDWVTELAEWLDDGRADRAAHPVSVILEKGASWPAELRSTLRTDTGGYLFTDAPSDIKYFVWDGQHRVAAWGTLHPGNDDPDAFWYAKVYDNGLCSAQIDSLPR